MSAGKKIKTTYTIRNKATLLKGGGDYFEQLKKCIDESSHFIQLQVYIFEEDSTGKKIAECLKNASKRGVKVQILLDGYASRNLSDNFLNTLRNTGIQVRFFNPLLKSNNFYFGRRLHHKIAVMDGYKAIVGGINISDRYNDLPNQAAWLDFAVLVEGETAYELHKLCLQFYHKKRNIENGIERIKANQKNDQNAYCPIRIRRNDWVMNKHQISGTYMEFFRNAQREITIMSSYFIPNKFFRNQMTSAVKRGVKIKLLLAGKSDVSIAKNAERYFYRWALRNKITIFEYTHSVLHSKLAICDERIVTIGSYNINDISAFASIELNLDIEEKTFARYVSSAVNEILQKESIEIREEDRLNKYKWIDQLQQWFSYIIFRFIFQLFTFYFSKKKV